MKLRFDRGTILLEDTGQGDRDAVARLPFVLWDGRVRAFRAPAWRYRGLCEELARLGLRALDEVLPPATAIAPFRPVELRPYQEAALEAWQLGGRRGILALPTGSGKTRTAIAAMAGVGLPTLCLVPTRVLLGQWHQELSRFYTGEVGCLGDGEHRLRPVTVATFESAYRRMAELGSRFQLLVVDEVHHFGVGIRDEALEMSVAHARLGLTATPPPGGEPLDHLARLIGPVVYELVICDLAGSFLASFDLATVSVELTDEEQLRYEGDMAVFLPAFRGFTAFSLSSEWSDFVRHAMGTEEGRRAVEAWRHSRRLLSFPRAKGEALRALLRRHERSRVLIFTADNEAAYAIAREHLVMPLTCDIGRAERDEALAKFRGGELRALVSSRVLNEGMDVPDADVAVIVGGTMGKREHIQRVGRTLRPAPGKHALVYDLVVRGTGEVAQARKRRQGLVSGKTSALRVLDREG